MELKSMELCTKGMNWGSVEFVGSTMHFNFDGKRVFEIPLAEVAQSSVPNRNELLMEFHHDDTITEDVFFFFICLHALSLLQSFLLPFSSFFIGCILTSLRLFSLMRYI